MGRYLSRYVESTGGLPPNGIVSHKVIPLSDLLDPAGVLGVQHGEGEAYTSMYRMPPIV